MAPRRLAGGEFVAIFSVRMAVLAATLVFVYLLMAERQLEEQAGQGQAPRALLASLPSYLGAWAGRARSSAGGSTLWTRRPL